MEMKFKIAMNNEEKLAGNVFDVVVNVEKCDDATMLKYALKAYTVEIQSQIRNNWDAFIKGDYPRELTIGQAMFTKRAAKVMTIEEQKKAVAADMNKLSETERLDALLMGGFITQEMYDSLIEAAVAKEDAQEAAEEN